MPRVTYQAGSIFLETQFLPGDTAVPRLSSRIAALFFAVQPVLEGLRDAAPWRPAAAAPTRMQEPHRSSVCRRALVTPGVPQI